MMIVEEKYLKRFILRFKTQIERLNTEIPLETTSFEKAGISDLECHIDNAKKNFFYLQELYNQVKIHYAEKDGGMDWSDSYKTDITSLNKQLDAISSFIDENLLGHNNKNTPLVQKDGIAEAMEKVEESTIDTATSIETEMEPTDTPVSTLSHTFSFTANSEDASPLDKRDGIGKDENSAIDLSTIRKRRNVATDNTSSPSIATTTTYTATASATTSAHNRHIEHLNERAQLLSNSGTMAHTMHSNNTHYPTASDHLDKSKVESIIKAERLTQSHLTEELLSMAETLKQNSLTFQTEIKADNADLNKAHDLTLKNLGVLEKQATRLDVFRSKSWKTTGFSWLLLFIVIAVFFILILLIRVVPKRY